MYTLYTYIYIYICSHAYDMPHIRTWMRKARSGGMRARAGTRGGRM